MKALLIKAGIVLFALAALYVWARAIFKLAIVVLAIVSIVKIVKTIT